MFPSFSYPEINKSPPVIIPVPTTARSTNGAPVPNQNQKNKEEIKRGESPIAGTSRNLQPLPVFPPIHFRDYDFGGNEGEGGGEEASAEMDSDDTITESINRFQFSSLPDLGRISCPAVLGSRVDMEDGVRRKKLTKKRIRFSDHDIFKNMIANIVHNKRNKKELISPNDKSAPISFLDVLPPLSAHVDLNNSIGPRRGICGSCIEWSYLDVSLFVLFYFTDSFDGWLLDENGAKEIPNEISRGVREALAKEVVYSLRTGYFCPPQHIAKIHHNIFPNSRRKLGQEMSKFLRALLKIVLTVEDTIHYTNGDSRVLHVIKYPKREPPPPSRDNPYYQPVQKNGRQRLPPILFHSSVQQLFGESLGDLKLLTIPSPALFLCLDGAISSPHSIIVPNIQLDLSKLLIVMRDDGDGDDDDSISEAVVNLSTSFGLGDDEDYIKSSWCGGDVILNLCQSLYAHVQNMALSLPGMEIGGGNFNWDDDDWLMKTPLISRTNQTQPSAPLLQSPMSSDYNRGRGQKLEQGMDLSAVFCLCPEKSGHFAFVRVGHNPRRGWAPWVIFEPMKDDGPSIRRIEDVPKWLLRLEKKPEKYLKPELWIRGDNVPQDIQTLLTTSTIFLYTPTQYSISSDSQMTLTSSGGHGQRGKASF